MNFLKGAWSAVSTWFGGLNITLIEMGLAVTVTLSGAFGLVQMGRHLERSAWLANNAAVALEYQAHVKAADDIAAKERADKEIALAQVAELKEQVKNVANGMASPGVDAATHGVRPTAPTRKAKLPGSH